MPLSSRVACIAAMLGPSGVCIFTRVILSGGVACFVTPESKDPLLRDESSRERPSRAHLTVFYTGT